MPKINRKNAYERIADMLKGFELKTDASDKYYEMTEAEYDAILESVLENCTKELRTYIETYTYKQNIAWLKGAKGGLIRTWGTVYATIKFIEDESVSVDEEHNDDTMEDTDDSTVEDNIEEDNIVEKNRPQSVLEAIIEIGEIFNRSNTFVIFTSNGKVGKIIDYTKDLAKAQDYVRIGKKNLLKYEVAEYDPVEKSVYFHTF